MSTKGRQRRSKAQYVPWTASELRRWASDVEQNHRARIRVTFLPGIRPLEFKAVGQLYRRTEDGVEVIAEDYTIVPSQSCPTLESAYLYLCNKLDAAATWVKTEVAPGA